MRKHTTLKALALCTLLGAATLLQAQNFKEAFHEALNNDSVALQEQILRDWRQRGGERDAAYHVARFNHFFNQAFAYGLQMSAQYPVGEENVMSVIDSAGNEQYMYFTRILMDTALLDSAIAAGQSGVGLSPQRLDIRFGIIHTLLTARRWDDAIAAINSTLDYSTEHRHQWLFDETMVGKEELSDAMTDYLGRLFYSVDLDAQTFSPEEESRIMAVRSIAQKVHAIDPKNAIPLNFIAISYNIFYDYRSSQPYLEEALKLDKKDLIVLSNLYTTALNNRDIATARRCLKGMKKYGDDDTRQWAREQLKQLK